MTGLKHILAISVILLSGLQLYSQERYTIGMGFGRQRVGVPFHDLLGLPPHTSLLAQVSINYGHPKPNSWYQNNGVLAFNNTSTGNGYLIFTHTGKNVLLTDHIILSPELGISMVHRFHPRQTFSISPEGVIQTSHPGKLRPGLDFRTSLAYRTNNLSLFVSYQINTEFFYNESLPFIPVNYLYLGVFYHLKPDQP